MATILEFRASHDQTQTRKPRARGPRRSAEIVIFPGVRYERWGDESDADTSLRVERDTLVRAE